MSTHHRKPAQLFDPGDRAARAIADVVPRSSIRATSVRNPVMFVVLRRQHADDGALWLAGARRPRRGAGRVHSARLALAVVHRAVRELRRGDGRRPRQGAGRGAARDAARHHRARSSREPQPRRDTRARWSGRRPAQAATSCWSKPATSSPPTARSIEGVASVDESAITGERAPVIRESGGDRSASPAARACSPTGSSCGSPPIPARPSSTA